MGRIVGRSGWRLNGRQGTGGQNPPWQQQKPKGAPGVSYSNTMKIHNNLSYLYSCGYNVDHNGLQFHPNTRKRTHIPNVGRNESHTIAGASMKVQHKTLPDGFGSGKGWILAQQLRKSNWVMDQQVTCKQQQQQQQWRG